MTLAMVMFNGSLYSGEVLRTTPKRMLVSFDTGGRHGRRERWFATVPPPEGRLVSRRVTLGPGDVTIPANAGFINSFSG